ncbi:MAG: RNA-binding protein [Pseudomonadota bacterium]
MSQSKIYVGNLPYSVTEQDLTDMFSKFGPTKQVNLITDKETRRSKGFAFVTFETAEAANASLQLDNNEVDGRKLRVNLAKEDGGTRTGGSRTGGSRSGGAGGGRSRDDDRW